MLKIASGLTVHKSCSSNQHIPLARLFLNLYAQDFTADGIALKRDVLFGTVPEDRCGISE